MNQAAPHSAEAEQGVLGSILLSPRQVIPDVTLIPFDAVANFVRREIQKSKRDK